MPLVGVIDPSHAERAHDHWGRKPEWLSVDEVLAASGSSSPKWSPWTFELVAAAVGEHQEREDRISTTLITGGDPRGSIIERKMDYIGSLDEMYAALRGTLVHRTLEGYTRPGAIPETRFFTTIDGIEISCSPDLLTEDTIWDYKVPSEVTGIPSFGYPFRHQTEQLMVNAYICRHAERWELPSYLKALPFDPREMTAKHAAIIYVGPKAPKVIEYERSEKLVTPAGLEKSVKRPYVWSDSEVLDFLRPRLHMMQQALAVFPEWPEPWEDVDTGKLYYAEDRYVEAPTKREPDRVSFVEGLWGGGPDWACPAGQVCRLPMCVAKRYPDGLWWPKP